MEAGGAPSWGLPPWLGGPQSWLRRGIRSLITSSCLPPSSCASATLLPGSSRNRGLLRLLPLLHQQSRPAALQQPAGTPEQQQGAAAGNTGVSSASPERPEPTVTESGAAATAAGGTTAAPEKGAAATPAAAAAAADAAADAAAAAAEENLPELHFCDTTNEPEDVCNAQWLVLWSYAAYAPEYPTKEEQQQLYNFFYLFPDQCTQGPAAYCYTQAVQDNPPRVKSRRELLLWLCMTENKCRNKLKIKQKVCRYNDLMKRWRYTDGYI